MQQIGNYTVEGKLGQGRFGPVLLTHLPENPTRVVIKIVDVSSADGKKNAIREIRALSTVSHKNIIQLYDNFTVAESEVPTTAVVMERADRGDLLNLIVQRKRLSEALARHLFKQMVDALSHCHEKGIVHRDLKPENILLDRSLNIKIADFGLSSTIDHTGTTLLREYCGSVEYASPEIIQNIPYHGPEVDIFSLGVVLFAMLTGQRPFPGKCATHLRNSMFSGVINFPSYLSAEAISLLRKMIAINSKDRATMADIQSHPWVRGTVATTTPAHTFIDETIPHKEEKLEQVSKTLTNSKFSHIMWVSDDGKPLIACQA